MFVYQMVLMSAIDLTIGITAVFTDYRVFKALDVNNVSKRVDNFIARKWAGGVTGVVEKLTSLLTSISNLTDRGMGSPSTPLALMVKNRDTYLLGAYVLAG